MSELPQIGTLLTLVVVKNSEIKVFNATVALSQDDVFEVQLDDLIEESYLEEGQRITVMYTHIDQIYRIKASIFNKISAERLGLSVVGHITKHDRREFTRVETQLHLSVRRLRATRYRDALDEIEADLKSVTKDSAWESHQVNLSGSGLKFRSDRECAIGDFYHVNLQLPFKAPVTISVLGEVARITTDEVGHRDVALKFIKMPKGTQDLIINYVFKCQYNLIDKKL